jgi:heme-degrading monooxygenase HmoA
MLANMTSVKSDGANLETEARMAAEALLPWVRQFDGYRGMIVLSDGVNGRARFVTFWEDQDAL